MEYIIEHLFSVLTSKAFWESQLGGICIGAGLTFITQLVFYRHQRKRDRIEKQYELGADIIGLCEKIRRIYFQLRISQFRLHYNVQLRNLILGNLYRPHADFKETAFKSVEYWQAKSDELGAEFESLRSILIGELKKIYLRLKQNRIKSYLITVHNELGKVELFRSFEGGNYFQDIKNADELYKKCEEDIISTKNN